MPLNLPPFGRWTLRQNTVQVTGHRVGQVFLLAFVIKTDGIYAGKSKDVSTPLGLLERCAIKSRSAPDLERWAS
ncbi:hypothetical protein [Accumulibacter sp.]|uniref:hypothetical protein n=1 Tax=Accumulibacter sp. TaxID=2053492 RepID=UPI0028C44650|nr:hypothetical protein [Accumulibacter sp.]